jgi:hypothetical protein
MNFQDKKKHKDHSDQPMQYSKFLKGVYDSSDEDEVKIRFAFRSYFKYCRLSQLF